MGEYCEGQWWLKELDAMAGTPDQRRAVAVVRKMMAEQHQGEPVALPARKRETGDAEYDERNGPSIEAWNACLDEIAKLGPLYTHADPGEVERLRDEIERMRERVTPTHKSLIGKHAEIIKERDALRALLEAEKKQHAQVLELATRRWNYIAKQDAQLAERDALLKEVLIKTDKWMLPDLYERIRLSLKAASAEPSAPAIHPINMKTMMQAYEQVDHKALLHETSNWCASMATALRGVIHSEPCAPVGVDERAAFEKEFAAKGRPLTRADYDPDAYGNAFDDGAWTGWQARAALGRKP